MKVQSIIIVMTCLFFGQQTDARDPEWFQRKMGELETALAHSDEREKIALLGTFVRMGTYGGMDDEQSIIFERARTALLSIPGHAQCYQDRLESLRAEVMANSKLPKEEVQSMQQAGNQPLHLGDYNDFRKQAFSVLAMLPSSETVAVLGHFLNDPEGLDHRNMLGDMIEYSDTVPYPVNAGAAAIALRRLGIEHPPFRPSNPNVSDYDYEAAELAAWKDWWQEVKDGRRTYRFIGSPIEYGRDGPASTEQVQRIDRNQKRDAERAAGSRKERVPATPGSE